MHRNKGEENVLLVFEIPARGLFGGSLLLSASQLCQSVRCFLFCRRYEFLRLFLVLFFQQGVEGEIPYVTSDYNYSILGSGKLKKKKHFKRREYVFECDYT